MIYAISHYAAAAAANLETTRPVFAALGVVFAYIVCRVYAQSGAPSIAQGQERSLGGKLVLISGAFDSAIGFALLSRLAEQRARVVALSEDPSSPRDQQLLHLARLASGNDQLYIERVIAPETFAADWERIGARRRGPIGEALGRQTVDSLVVVLREGMSHDEATKAWAVVEALEPSLSTPAPRTSDGIDPGAGAGLVRILTVVPSPFYAAAARRSDARPTDDASTSLHFAGVSAAAQRRFDRTRAVKPTLNRLVFLAAAPGLTRSAMTRFLAPRPSRLFDVGWARWLVVAPGAWLCGQDSTRAARGIDWALRAPLQLVKDGALVRGIRPGAFLRDGKDVFLEAIADDRKTDAALATESTCISELKPTWAVQQKAHDELKAALKTDEAKS